MQLAGAMAVPVFAQRRGAEPKPMPLDLSQFEPRGAYAGQEVDLIKACAGQLADARGGKVPLNQGEFTGPPPSASGAVTASGEPD